MTAAQSFPLMTVDEYLAFEESAEVRHEYVGGYVYAMAGARTGHNRIVASALRHLGNLLEGSTCEPLGSDVKVRIRLPTHSRLYYPDAMVVCGADDPAAVYQDAPVVLVEVLSDSTRRTDEGEKREAYLTIPSLAAYLLVEPERPAVCVYRRGEAGFAAEQYTGLDAVIPLTEIDAELPLASLYERVEFPPPAG
ncbi:MAG: Uma2 family endonuclease [Planctomycetota bacterium]